MPCGVPSARIRLVTLPVPGRCRGELAERGLRVPGDGDGMTLVWPTREYLLSYVAALERGWSPDSLRGDAAARCNFMTVPENPFLDSSRNAPS